MMFHMTSCHFKFIRMLHRQDGCIDGMCRESSAGAAASARAAAAAAASKAGSATYGLMRPTTYSTPIGWMS